MSERTVTPIVDPETANDARTDVRNIHTDVVKPHEDAPAERHVDNPGGGKTLGILFALVVLAAIAYGIYHRHQTENALVEKTEVDSIPTVSVTHPVSGSKADQLVLPGSVQAFVETPIYSRTNGYLRKWFFDIGSRVKKGQLLAIIETPETDQQLLQSRAELNRQEANEQLAKTTSDRWQSLLAKHAVSQQEADQAKSNYIAAQAASDASRAGVKRLEELQGYERIVAPFNGTITSRNTDIGDLINAGSGSASPRALFQLAQTDRMRVFASVPEMYANRIHNGTAATISQDSAPGEAMHGFVTRNADAIDRTTRTLNVEVDLNNPDGKLRPGAYVFAHFNLPGSGSAFTIPSNTLLFRAEGPRVAIVRDDRVHLQAVHVGHDYGDTVEVVSGVDANDAIILDPSDSLVDGAHVRVSTTNTKGTR
ncbi:RND family efflux transporter, MFP subunit [Terriglobus roseus DSM 18391]|uniref:RND family efflux transporter, MFP subunit n=1 Tax=Terriglobus roseus (strain DSM 18391 / NRRL B-41598 / KBS 63) TaxID=926566 RepID=I3ZED5_TERRK|nr:efflux RND transporter periplasmic adaptor subunit [Terriglobus roseus]AFL87603.1 RND family efflux transporter, MFP subunit [Terriglobus roseus DSM 18391]